MEPSRHRLVVIGVHAPEFDVERDVDDIVHASRDLRVDHPIAIGTDDAIWHAFGNHYWPALYLIGAQGQMRHHRLGEGDHERSERVIGSPLTEAGAPGISTGAGTVAGAVKGRGVEAAADWEQLRSPETSFGYERTENFVSLGNTGPDARHVHAVPERLRLNHWGRQPGRVSERRFEIPFLDPGKRAYVVTFG